MNQPIDYFSSNLTSYPRCANDPAIDNGIRCRDSAVDYLLIEPNTAGSIRWLTFDIDRKGAALDWEDCHVPPPSIVCRNPTNGHAHLLYALKAPVARSSCAKQKPLNYLEMIEHSLRVALQADRGYSGTLVKNPLHSHWQPKEWGDIYTLDELADELTIVPRERRAANDNIAGLGRNCETFELLSKYAYSSVRKYWGTHQASSFELFCAELEDFAGKIQGDFLTPLAFNEIRAIARSVARWVWRKFDPSTFRAIQTARGKRKGGKRRAELLPQAIQLSQEGCTQCEIASALDISQGTVSNWLKKSRQ